MPIDSGPVPNPQPALTLLGLIEAQAECNPHNIAILTPRRGEMTYGRLKKSMDSLISDLQSYGILPNQRVAMVLPNGPEAAICFLAAASCAECAPLNPGYRESEFEFYLQDLDAQALIVAAESDSPAVLAARALGIPVLELTSSGGLASGIFTLAGPSIPAKGQIELAQPDSIALVLHTSGTTAKPKIVPLSQRNLCASARNIRETLQLTPADRCLNIMPLFHIHGLIGALLSSLSAGASVICSPGFYATDFFGWIDDLEPTWYTAVPTMHQTILTRADANKQIIDRRQLRFIRSSSAALPPQVMAELESAFNTPVIEAYGMTEASHQMASNPLPPRMRKPGSVGVAAGPKIGIMDTDGSLLAEGATGEIVIQGANITQGYADNPTANASAFTNGWFRTGDQGYLDSEGYLYITGRLKELINRGGEKISPREIDEVLMDHPAVAQAVAFAAPHRTLGEDVAAAVVLHPGRTVTEAELCDFASARLADFKVPRKIIFLPEIPKGPTGKLQRVGLAEKLGITSGDSDMVKQDYIAPRTEMETELVELWRETLHIDKIGVSDNFFFLGGDSMLATKLITKLRAKYDVTIPLHSLFKSAPDIANQAQMILRKQYEGTEAQVKIAPVSRENSLPLSFVQQSLWFMTQLEPETPLYNRPSLYKLTGKCNKDILERSLNAIMDRHEALRTRITTIEGEPFLTIFPHCRVPLSEIDLSHLASTELPVKIEQIVREEAIKPFDLAKDVMLRASLIHINADEHYLLLNMHHIASDGSSNPILLSELAEFYTAFTEERRAELNPLPIQYADFSSWQRRYAETPIIDEHLSYWRGKLDGAPPALTLPSNRVRPPVQKSYGKRQSIAIGPELLQSLRALARETGSTLYMVLAAAFNMLLLRYTGQEDIVIGAPIAGRGHVEVEPLIGCFMNILAIRTDLSGNPAFTDLLERVRQTVIEAYEHQDIPFEKLVEDLHPERNQSHAPICQAILNLQKAAPTLCFAGLELSEVGIDPGIARFDLSLELFEGPNTLNGYLEYNIDLFDAATIKQMAGHFHMLLESIAKDPSQTIGALPMLSDRERHRLLVEWNDTAVDFAAPDCLHTLFEMQAERSPENIAIIFEDRSLTYRQLNQKANRLARHLQSLGVGPGIFVGIHMRRSLEMIIALFGILKSGGAYVPLDPDYPPERITYMLEDTKASVVLIQKSLSETLPETNATVISLDDGALDLWPGEHNPDILISGNDTAYVIYTSGSTGSPKGAINSHAAVCNRVLWMVNTYPFGAADSILQKTPYSFDVSVWEFFCPLVCGARLVIARPGAHGDSGYLIDCIRRNGITMVHFVPSMLQAFLEDPRVSECASLVRVFCSGEALLSEHRTHFFSCLNAELHNLYGPTEAAVEVSYWQCHASDTTATVPIGRPVANTKLYILDKLGQPVPIGVLGELHIGGVQVGKGYLNNAELTDAKFVPDPFRPETCGKLYKTGDLTFFRPDGNIEYAGRLDHQVKIRGFRIELGEVEEALAHHPAIRECVVIVREDTPRDKRLVAYYVPREQALTGPDLRNYLSRKLPDHMIPTAFLALDSLPLLLNGKLDRKALPAVSYTLDSTRYVDPLTTVQHQLVRIWEELLDVHPVGVTDDFFELGGHSLLAARMFARIAEEFGRNLPLATLFSGATILHLEEALLQKIDHQANLVAVQPEGDNTPFFFVHGDLAGGGFFCLRLSRLLGKDQPFYALAPHGLDQEETMPTIERMAKAHIASVRAIQPTGPYLLGGWCNGGMIAFEMGRQLEAMGEIVSLMVVIDANAKSARMRPLKQIVRWTMPKNERNSLAELYRYLRVRQFVLDGLRLSAADVRQRRAIGDKLPSDRRPDIMGMYNRAVSGYTPGRYRGKVTLLRAANEPSKHVDHPLLWWNQAAAEVEMHSIPGDHVTALVVHTDTVAKILKDCLRRATAGI